MGIFISIISLDPKNNSWRKKLFLTPFSNEEPRHWEVKYIAQGHMLVSCMCGTRSWEVWHSKPRSATMFSGVLQPEQAEEKWKGGRDGLLSLVFRIVMGSG